MGKKHVIYHDIVQEITFKHMVKVSVVYKRFCRERIIKLNETYLKMKLDFNSVGTNSLRIVGLNM